MKKLLFLILLFCNPAFAQQIDVHVKGAKKSTYSVSQLNELVKEETVTLYDPVLKETIAYVGFDFTKLLAKLYSDAELKSAEEVLMTCSDGYQPSIPSTYFQGKKRSLLVYKRADGKPFSYTHPTRGATDLGPFYMVWDNSKWTDNEKADESHWPYQVAVLDLIRFEDKFPKLSPPKNASAEVKEGFVAFRNYCMTCHKINGDGGEIAPELNYPVNVTEYFKEPFLRKFIEDPQSIRAGSKMDSFMQKVPDSKKKVNVIIAYLTAMKSKKIKP